jgi:hypothetical protein
MRVDARTSEPRTEVRGPAGTTKKKPENLRLAVLHTAVSVLRISGRISDSRFMRLAVSRVHFQTLRLFKYDYYYRSFIFVDRQFCIDAGGSDQPAHRRGAR